MWLGIFLVAILFRLWKIFSFVALEKGYPMGNTRILVFLIFVVKYLLKDNSR